MVNRILSFAALLAMFLVPASLHAQQAENNPSPPYRGISIHIPGITITPVDGAPFSATEEVRNEQTLPDGTVDVKRTWTQIGRDTRGRIHDEVRSLVPADFHGTPRLRVMHLYDPRTRLSTYCNPVTLLAQQHLFLEPEKKASVSNSQEKIEDLGTSTINGLFVRGTRHIFTVSAKASGTGAPVAVTNEYWYSQDLQINVLIRRTDPRTGTQTVSLADLKREEPDQSFFEVPEGYKIVDMTPPDGAPVSHDAMGIGGGITP
jgi:hypothetical protein